MTAQTSRENPDEVLQRLSAGATEGQLLSLERIHAVCKEQRARGSQDFRLTTIGRLLREAGGGPATKSLGNKKSLLYRTLIYAHREAAQTGQSRKHPQHVADDLLAGVRDPGQRARIEDLRAQVGSLQQEVRDLKRIVNASARVVLDAGATGSGQARFVGPPAPAMLDYERDALKDAVSPSWLQRVGLVEGRQGRLESARGGEVFPVGFASGLRKVLALLGGEEAGGSGAGGSTRATR